MISINRKLTDAEDELRITKWLHPNGHSETSFGEMSNEDWLLCESERVGKCDIVYSEPSKMMCLKWDDEMLEPLRGVMMREVDMRKKENKIR